MKYRLSCSQALLLLSATLLIGCDSSDSLDRILKRGELIVVSRNGPATFYEDKSGPAGFEYALSNMFAKNLGVRLRMEAKHNIADILQSVRRGQADMAAAGLSITPMRQLEFQFSRPYADIQAQVIYVSGTFRPRKIEDLYNSRLLVVANSSHAEALQNIQSEHPDLHWQEINNAEPPDLLDMVTSGAATYALIDSNEFVANQSFYPKLRTGFNITSDTQLAWLFTGNNSSARLLQRVDAFFDEILSDGTLEQLKEQHFGHAWGVTQVDSQTFSRRMRNRLPKYATLLRSIADEYQLDWHLLAAIAYQESHWDPCARSPTGVRGLMMLTTTTALEMNVSNRLDPIQSLRGGARYFKKIKRLLPLDIEEPDRTWFSLAAYNVGRGHLEDARVITERQGGDPDLWVDVKQRLPLLQKSKYYRRTKHGYARGSEPVTYVKNIRHYYNILAWQDISKNSPPASVIVDQHLPEILKTSRLSAL